MTPVVVRETVQPPWTFRLRGRSKDGLFVRRGEALQRLVHVGEEPVFCGVVHDREGVRFAARARTEAAALEGVSRMRFSVGVDDDLAEFHRRFARDRYIGRAVRSVPGLRIMRRPSPWEALAWAITEQLIEFDRAVGIQRRMIAAFGRRCEQTGLRDAPPAEVVAGIAPARLESFDLVGHRAITLRRAAAMAARLDLHDESSWAPLRSIKGVGAWTIEMLALQGQGRYDQIPAGDVGYLKLIGRLETGNPKARADVDGVYAFFTRYGEWQGLAAEYLRIAGARGWLN
ncbi:MAG: DNA-3-methyladenine glycosylase [Solirubrobacteraceae bacterium]|nr:DNA-3-methyladenine glycosylase [Solirubrobacteraceae bacterium]